MRQNWTVNRESDQGGDCWCPTRRLTVTCLTFALMFLAGPCLETVWAQAPNSTDATANSDLEPLAPNNRPIQVEGDELGAPPVPADRNRPAALRKALKAAPVGQENVDVVEAAPPAEENAQTTGPTAANAAKLKKLLIPTDPVGLFIAGGHLMPLILMASIISLWFGLERMVALRWGRVIPRAFVDRFLQHLEQGKLTPEAAIRLCEENKSPMADVFAHGVRKWGKTSVEVEQAIIDGGERQVSQLRTHLRIINGVATIAPLLGLLGTVFGMIMSFNELAQGSDVDRGERLAYGIGVALITTAAGLIVAIPSLVLYMGLSGRVDRLVMDMDQLAQKVVNLISAEALASRPRPSGAKPNGPVATTGPASAQPGKPKPVGT